MSVQAFAIFCFLGFLIPVPVLAWLDRPRRKGGDSRTPPSTTR